MTVLVKDITGDIQKFYNAKIYLNKNAGVLEVIYMNHRNFDGSKRRRNYILSNLISYEVYQIENEEGNEKNESKLGDRESENECTDSTVDDFVDERDDCEQS